MSGEVGMDRDDTRAALLALVSMHLPEMVWDDDDHVGRIGCSCGRGLYVGHLVTLIVNRLHGEEMAEWERELLEREARLQVMHVVDDDPPQPTPAATEAAASERKS